MPEDSDDEQLRGEDFMVDLDRRIQALTPEDMADTGEDTEKSSVKTPLGPS